MRNVNSVSTAGDCLHATNNANPHVVCIAADGADLPGFWFVGVSGESIDYYMTYLHDLSEIDMSLLKGHSLS